MQTTTPELSPDLQARLEDYKTARGRFELARDEFARREADTQRFMKALDAAENEARQAREEAATLMRNPDALQKDIFQLKAKERAGYTMAEEYRAIVEEQKVAMEEAKLSAGVAKREEGVFFTSLLNAYADELAREAAKHLKPVLRALHIQQQAFVRVAAVPWLTEWEHGHHTAREAASGRILKLIEQCRDTFEYDEASDAVLQAATRPAGLDRFEVVTAFGHKKQKEQLEQAAKQLRQHCGQPATEVQQ